MRLRPAEQGEGGQELGRALARDQLPLEQGVQLGSCVPRVDETDGVEPESAHTGCVQSAFLVETVCMGTDRRAQNVGTLTLTASLVGMAKDSNMPGETELGIQEHSHLVSLASVSMRPAEGASLAQMERQST